MQSIWCMCDGQRYEKKIMCRTFSTRQASTIHICLNARRSIRCSIDVLRRMFRRNAPFLFRSFALVCLFVRSHEAREKLNEIVYRYHTRRHMRLCVKCTQELFAALSHSIK